MVWRGFSQALVLVPVSRQFQLWVVKDFYERMPAVLGAQLNNYKQTAWTFELKGRFYFLERAFEDIF